MEDQIRFGIVDADLLCKQYLKVNDEGLVLTITGKSMV